MGGACAFLGLVPLLGLGRPATATLNMAKGKRTELVWFFPLGHVREAC